MTQLVDRPSEIALLYRRHPPSTASYLRRKDRTNQLVWRGLNAIAEIVTHQIQTSSTKMPDAPTGYSKIRQGGPPSVGRNGSVGLGSVGNPRPPCEGQLLHLRLSYRLEKSEIQGSGKCSSVRCLELRSRRHRPVSYTRPSSRIAICCTQSPDQTVDYLIADRSLNRVHTPAALVIEPVKANRARVMVLSK